MINQHAVTPLNLSQIFFSMDIGGGISGMRGEDHRGHGKEPSAASISDYLDRFQRAGVKSLLIDWDGCMTPVMGLWHGSVALAALQRGHHAEVFHGCTVEDAAKAYEGPGHGIDWFTLFQNNLVEPRLRAAGINSVLPCIEELRSNIDDAARMFSDNKVHADGAVWANSGVSDFLATARRAGLALHVVSMTPTPMVHAIADRAGLGGFFDSIRGCEQFAHFKEGKRDPELWRSAAEEKQMQMSEVVVLEDNHSNLRAALQAGVAGVISAMGPVASEDEELVGNRLCYYTGATGDFRSLICQRG